MVEEVQQKRKKEKKKKKRKEKKRKEKKKTQKWSLEILARQQRYRLTVWQKWDNNPYAIRVLELDL